MALVRCKTVPHLALKMTWTVSLLALQSEAKSRFMTLVSMKSGRLLWRQRPCLNPDRGQSSSLGRAAKRQEQVEKMIQTVEPYMPGGEGPASSGRKNP